MLSMMQRNGSRLPFVFLGIVGIMAAVALLLYLPKLEKPQGPGADDPPPPTAPATPAPPEPDPIPELNVDPDPPGEDPTTVLQETGVIKPGDPDPQTLLENIGRALEAGDMKTVERLIGQDVLPPAQRAKLSELAAGSGIRLRSKNPVREVGELEFNKLSRWALELESDGLERILFDLRRNQERWMVERMTLPEGGKGPPRASLADALEMSDMFIQALMRLDFESARLFVDGQKVSDAKIAALCILFEEGGYKLRQQKPLRRLFERSDAAGFLANVVASSSDQSAQFGLTMQRPDAQQPWRVAEINLDSLLADYAQRVAGGDVYYTPLVNNPQGGDTLVLYFEFDAEGLTERAARQLEIVARILLSDETKKLTISGHTDALGTDNYNDSLSSRRARTVRDYLAGAGVAPAQIITVAKGKSQPRRPNVLEDGTDNPLGRRANRRTEIYLDF
jgi:outer membrane protein OmpA-like peptidoglycan-associated protein